MSMLNVMWVITGICIMAIGIYLIVKSIGMEDDIENQRIYKCTFCVTCNTIGSILMSNSSISFTIFRIRMI